MKNIIYIIGWVFWFILFGMNIYSHYVLEKDIYNFEVSVFLMLTIMLFTDKN